MPKFMHILAGFQTYCNPPLVPSGVIQAKFYHFLSGPAIDPWSCLKKIKFKRSVQYNQMSSE